MALHVTDGSLVYKTVKEEKKREVVKIWEDAGIWMKSFTCLGNSVTEYTSNGVKRGYSDLET